MIAAYRWVADKTYATVLARGKYIWNQVRSPPSCSPPRSPHRSSACSPLALAQFLNNDHRCISCGDCPGPWVTQGSCAASLRSFCNASGPLHTRAMMYGLSGVSDKDLQFNWTTMSNLKQVRCSSPRSP